MLIFLSLDQKFGFLYVIRSTMHSAEPAFFGSLKIGLITSTTKSPFSLSPTTLLILEAHNIHTRILQRNNI